MQKIEYFTDLVVWQKAHELALEIYRITGRFPDTEKFGLLVQMRRASTSITANIAEGFGRRGIMDKVRFYDFAVGSLYELQDQLFMVRDLTYIPVDQFQSCLEQSQTVQRLIIALIRSIKAKH